MMGIMIKGIEIILKIDKRKKVEPIRKIIWKSPRIL